MSAPTWHRPAWSKPAWLVAALAAALVVCCPLPSTAFAEAPPTLNLSASDGPPGGDVGARVEGFGECVADIESSPSPEPDPDPPVVLRLVSIPALAAPAGTSGTVVLTWDGSPLTTVTVAAATAGLTLRVPADAGAGTHSVSAACAEDSKVFAERRFVVRPVAAPVPVPDLTSQTIPQATLTLREAGLSLGDVSGSGDEIVRQVPAAGTVAQPGSSVGVVLGGEPSLVRVPYVVGRTRHEAKVALRSAGLRPGSVTGTGNLVLGQSVTAGTAVPAGTTVTISVEVRPSSRVLVPRLIGLSLREASRELGDLGLVVGHTSGQGAEVHGQRPRAGVRVPRGSAVSVTVEDGAIPPPPPPVTVPVPDVTGGTFAVARATLTHAGLLARTADGDRGETVESQKPRAGMLVAAGTVVTMRGAVPVSLTSGSTGTWRTLVLLVAGLGVGLGAAHRALKNDRAPDWVHTHVRLVAGAAPRLTAVRVEARQDARPAHVVRLAPHSDPGTSVLEEVRP